jgi:hypothetical protein
LQSYTTSRWNTGKHMYKTPENTWNICLQHACVIYFCNIRMEDMKLLEHIFKTYAYSHYNMCIILIYFINIHIQHLQRTLKISETLETYYCNIHFQYSICLLLAQMEVRRCWAQCRHIARSHAVVQSSPLWSSSVVRTSVGAGECSMATTRGPSPGVS